MDKKTSNFKIEIEINQLHEDWAKSVKLHCIHCGSKTVWNEGIDFNQGFLCLCLSCGSRFNTFSPTIDPEDSQRIEKIKAGFTQ